MADYQCKKCMALGDGRSFSRPSTGLCDSCQPDVLETIDVDPTLAEVIAFWDGFGVPVRWHIFTEGNQAIGIGEGFLWSIEVDADGSVHTHEVNVALEWETGIAI